MQQKLIGIVIILILITLGVFVFLTRSGTPKDDAQETATSTNSAENPSGQISNVRILRRPDSLKFTSTVCRNNKPEERRVEIIVEEAQIFPECVMVREPQVLRLENNTDDTLTFTLDRLPPEATVLATTTIPAGRGETLEMQFGNYLGRGVHVLKLSDGRSIEIVMLD